ncbi:MAG TPA: YhdP family protein [Usitatibacter sp.]|nr:YhdP family protein [Usitatibacter sp.]
MPRFLFRLAKGVAALLVLGFALAVMWLRYVALPDIDRYRERVVQSISQSTGMQVSARELAGGWDGLRPFIRLEGFAINDRRGRVALGFERAEVTLSWWSLFTGHVHFHDVDFYRPALELRRAADGRIYLGDKPLNDPNEPADGRFTEWMLAQPRLSVHEATLTWRDDKAQSPELRFDGVEIAMRKRLGRHHAALTARPPPGIASRIDLRADVRLVRENMRWVPDGDLFFEARDADLGLLRTHVPVPETLRSGSGNLRVWAHVNSEGVKEVVADVALRDASAQLASDAAPLALESLSGRATYRTEIDGFTFAAEKLGFKLANGVAAQVGSFALSRRGARGKAERVEARADGIDLKIAAALIDYFPLPRDTKQQIVRFAPRGRILDAAVSWDAADPGREYSVKARFEDLGIDAVDNYPGAWGVSGSVEGTQAGGHVEIAAKKAGFELARLFREPLAFDRVDAKATWQRTGKVLEVKIAEAGFANADGEGTVSGTWHSLPDSKVNTPGYADLKGTFSHLQSRRVAQYMPNGIATTRDWLDRSVLSGVIDHADFVLKGDIWHFPFGEGADGHYLVTGDIHDAQLKYHPEWPSVDAIHGTFRFENRRIEIHADKALIFASRATNVSAVIPDLGVRPPVLSIDGDIDTTGADSVRFLRESPLVNGPGAFTKAVAIEGPGRLKLQLVYPLNGTDVRVAGDYTFTGATATVGKSLAMKDVHGHLGFTERGVRAPQLTGSLFGEPATLTMATQPDGQVVTQIEGHIAPPAARDYVPETILSHLAGGASWKAVLASGKLGSELTLTSDLSGLDSTLPDPFAKDAAEVRPAKLTIAKLGQPDEVSTFTFGNGVHGRFTRSNDERFDVALKFGAPIANEPVKDGLWLYGNLAYADLDAWQGLFPGSRAEGAGAGEETGLVLRGIDLKLARTRYWGRDFRDMAARLERDGSRWSGTLESPRISGDVQWSWAGKGRLVAKLDHLAIAEPTAGTAPSPDAAKQSPSDLPTLDVTAKRFEFKDRWLGALDLKAEPDGEDWRIDKLDIVTDHAQLHSSGRWRRAGEEPLTTLDVTLDVENLNAFMGQFGYADYLKRGNGKLEGRLVWPGYPYDFAVENLAGTFKAEAHRGQFAKIEPGAGKLLGLLSLQSLPQRATFDFRDVFSAGFAFDRIEGDVKLARGVLLIDGFEIAGPSAFVSMSGEISIPHETETLTLHVVPEVGEGLALAATIIGTPVLGLSTLLVTKLLKNPLGKVVAYEYQVTGSWDNPQVSRLSAPPAQAAANPPAEPARTQSQ